MKLKAAVIILAVILGLGLLTIWPRRSRGATSTLTGTYADAQGNPFNGTLVLYLPIEATDTSSGNDVAPTPVTYSIINGTLQAGPPLYDVAGLQPQGLYYIAKRYDSMGNLVASGNYVVTGSPFQISAAVPTTITTSNISYANPVTTGVNNSFTVQQLFSSIGSLTGSLSSIGFIQMASTDFLAWRNNANSGNIQLSHDASDNLNYNGHILVGSNGNIPVTALNGGSGASNSTFWRGDGTWAGGIGTNIACGGVQFATAPITGNSSAQVVYTCTLAGGAVATNQGVRVSAYLGHSGGSAAVTYAVTLNGSNYIFGTDNAIAGDLMYITGTIMAASSTTGVGTGVLTQSLPAGGAKPPIISFNGPIGGMTWASNQTLTVTFNVANTDTVTGDIFLVELIH